MADVFLSYKREDAAKVRKLVAALRDHGLDTWWDEDIPASAPWEATIEAELARAKAVIVCWSPGAVASDNVRSEARVAREDGRLIQIFLKPCEPPLFFGERQGVELFKWRGNADDPRIVRTVDAVRKVAAGERVQGGERPKARRLQAYALAAAALVLLVLGFVGWRELSPVRSVGPTTLAILPFRALNASDANLVDAVWDDTRGAISRNPNLRVLGRETVTLLAAEHLEPAAYKRKAGADYLLDGSMEHVGELVRLKLSLVRTSDGAEMWSDQLGGKLDDVFAFQARIASEVEGRIRGRLAPAGGAVAKNIATSAEVYAIYAQARAKIRNRSGSIGKALPLLKQALALDPNYAPAWTDLGYATSAAGEGSIDDVRRRAIAYVKRALVLAPNLAHAHAVLGQIRHDSPEGESELRRAIALDPSDGEAWMWLGNRLLGENKIAEALKAHSRAVEVDPLWFIAMYNKMDDLAALGDMRGLAEELRRAENTGDEHLILLARAHFAYLTGHPGTQARFVAEYQRKFPDEPHVGDVAAILLQLGYIDEAAKVAEWPPNLAASFKGEPESPQMLRSDFKQPIEFWRADDGLDAPAMRYAVLLPKHGRLAEYMDLYKRAFRNVDEFHDAVDWPGDGIRWLRLAPNAVANLRAGGEAQQADAVVQKTESIIAPLLRNGPPDLVLTVNLSQLRAVEGRNDEAVELLGRAVARGWLPDRVYYAADIADEPCFASLVNRADFQLLRRRIAARYDEERRAVDPVVQQLVA